MSNNGVFVREGIATVGMRVGFNVRARRTLGICNGRDRVRGTIVEIGHANEFGSSTPRIKWDDGEWGFVNVYWLRRVEWSRGGYTHGKRKDGKE